MSGVSKGVNKDVRGVRGSRGTPGGVRGGVKVSQGVKRCVPGVEGSVGDPGGLRGMSGVYQGLKEAPEIYNKRVAFCKIHFPYFAREKW